VTLDAATRPSEATRSDGAPGYPQGGSNSSTPFQIELAAGARPPGAPAVAALHAETRACPQFFEQVRAHADGSRCAQHRGPISCRFAAHWSAKSASGASSFQVFTRLGEEIQHSRPDSLGLGKINVVALSALARTQCGRAAVFVLETPEQCRTTGPLAPSRRLRCASLGRPSTSKISARITVPPGNNRAAVFRDRSQSQLANVAGVRNIFESAFQPGRRDGQISAARAREWLSPMARHGFRSFRRSAPIHRLRNAACTGSSSRRGSPSLARSTRFGRDLAVAEKKRSLSDNAAPSAGFPARGESGRLR